MKLIALITAQSARLKQAGVSFGHGTTNAFDEAAWLVLWSLGLPLDALEAKAHLELSADEEAKAVALVTQRIDTRKPAAYLTQEAWLQNVPFYVDERTIVPRSFIAELLADGEQQGTLDTWLSDETKTVLDLCTGNGSLAVIAAMAYPEVTVDAADISEDALAVARINVDTNHLDAIGLARQRQRSVRPDRLQPALRQHEQHECAARRVQGRTGIGAGWG
jgi:ribosomal protein L3 glutamine methyltransferase